MGSVVSFTACERATSGGLRCRSLFLGRGTVDLVRSLPQVCQGQDQDAKLGVSVSVFTWPRTEVGSVARVACRIPARVLPRAPPHHTAHIGHNIPEISDAGNHQQDEDIRAEHMQRHTIGPCATRIFSSSTRMLVLLSMCRLRLNRSETGCLENEKLILLPFSTSMDCGRYKGCTAGLLYQGTMTVLLLPGTSPCFGVSAACSVSSQTYQRWPMCSGLPYLDPMRDLLQQAFSHAREDLGCCGISGRRR
ncbi:hypothetical protein V8F06_007669 [Rhypophila decipiens]